jgi:cytochrome c oxidase subunit 2
MFRYLPEQASAHAPEVDWLHNLITDISVFFTVAIVGYMIYYAIKYRKRNGVDHETPQIHSSETLEVLWTVVPTIICIYILYYGIVIFRDMREVPKNAEVINVRAQSWKWDFQYDNGKKTTNEVVIPVNKPVKMVLSSSDVLHSFFIPAMRVKSDAVPGSDTYVAFTPVKVGEYPVFCTEYCGGSDTQGHWSMQAKLRVVSESDYEQWLADRSEETAKAAMKPSDLGKKLYVEKGCNACHSLDGTRLVGPSFLKIYNREGELQDGSKYVADENYIRKSIYDPNSQVVKGYPANQMPGFEGQISEDELLGLVAFMRTLDGSTPVEAVPVPAAPAAADLAKMTPEQRGEQLYNGRTCNACHSLDGSQRVGPSFKGLYGKAGNLEGGVAYKADDAYLKKAIQQPAAEVVQGYPAGAMPNLGINDDEVSDLIAYIKSIK